MSMHRGILGVGIVVATGLALQTGALFGALGAPTTSDGRAYDTSKFGLTLEGNFAGWLRSADASISGELVTEKIGVSHVIQKHVANPKYEEIHFEMGLNDSKALYGWMRADMNGEYARRSGSIIVGDFNYNEVRRINFFNALITEIDFPALDASSKDAGFLSVHAVPEEMRWVQGSGTTVSSPASSKVDRRWMPSHFRVSIDGIDASKVSKVDAIQFKQFVIDAAIGTTRDATKMPTQISISNLKLTIPDVAAPPFLAWAQKSMVSPGAAQTNAKNGSISFLDDAMKNDIVRLDLSGLTIVKIAPVKIEPGGDQTHRMTVEIAIRQMLPVPSPGTTFD